MQDTTKKESITSIYQDLVGLKKLWPYLTDRRNVWIAILLIPIISLIQVAQPYILKLAIDEGIIISNTDKLMWYSIGFFGLILAEYLTRTGQSLSTAIAVYKMIVSLRRKTVTHILSLKPSYHDHSMSGALVTRATSDFDNLSESLSTGLVKSIVDLAVLIGCIVSMFVLDWRLALVSIVILPLTTYVMIKFSQALKNNTLLTRKKISTLNAYTQECLYGNSTIKLLTAKNDANSKYAGLNDDYRRSQMKVVVYDALLFSVLDGISSIAIGMMLWVTVTNVFGVEMFSAGVLVAFVRLMQNLFEPLKQLGLTMSILQGVFTAIERIFQILDVKEFLHGSQTIERFKGQIVFKNTSFAYSKKDGSQDGYVIQDINFDLNAGESLALVGTTGSGKSTIVKLLSKQYDQYQGDIYIDGINLADIDPDHIKKHIAIVPQDIVLFNGTIAFNIGLGLKEISLDDIKNAAKIVGADQFIDKLPGGYDFIVREQGENLSHGQRQLIAFARALAKDPKLVILDEATSSVDPQAEVAIQSAIANIFKDRTVVVIAHRLSTIRECDKIFVMQKGKIIERGNHDSLIQQNGEYAKLNMHLYQGV